MLNIVFMGSPEFAVPCLNAIAEHPNARLVGVVSQPISLQAVDAN